MVWEAANGSVERQPDDHYLLPTTCADARPAGSSHAPGLQYGTRRLPANACCLQLDVQGPCRSILDSKGTYINK